jgi:hypothetical protein
MSSSGMLRRVALIRTEVSEEVVFLRSMLRLLVTANVLSSPILTLIMEAIISTETRVLTRGTRRNISGVCILHVFLSTSHTTSAQSGSSCVLRMLLTNAVKLLVMTSSRL